MSLSASGSISGSHDFGKLCCGGAGRACRVFWLSRILAGPLLAAFLGRA